MPRPSELCDICNSVDPLRGVICVECHGAIVAKRNDLIDRLAGALRDLVKTNEEWNQAVAAIIGRMPAWNDRYLDRAREVLAKEGQ